MELRHLAVLGLWLTAVRAADQNSSLQTTTKREEKGNATLYHYFPHNQHLFQLPDCAAQQVCNAVYLRYIGILRQWRHRYNRASVLQGRILKWPNSYGTVPGPRVIQRCQS